MVRFKNRYLVVEIAHNDGRAMEDARKERDLLDAIRDAVKENFGDVGAGRAVAALSVRYADAMTGVCVVRCDRERARAVRGAVTTMEGFRGRRAAFAVTHCGGTVRGARDACVRRLSSEVTRASRRGTGQGGGRGGDFGDARENRGDGGDELTRTSMCNNSS